MADVGLEKVNGIEAKAIVVEQLRAALDLIRQHEPTGITTLGGECSVSVAAFSALAGRYADDLAILWIDPHPDVGTGASETPATMPWQSHSDWAPLGQALVEGALLRQLPTQLEMAAPAADVQQRPTGSDRRVGQRGAVGRGHPPYALLHALHYGRARRTTDSG